MRDRSTQGITPLFPCDVECISSAKYGERPTAVLIEQERLEIEAIIRSWRSPDGPVFQVLTKNDQAFELTFNEASDQWSFSAI